MQNIIAGGALVIGIAIYVALLVRDIIAYNKVVKKYQSDDRDNV